MKIKNLIFSWIGIAGVIYCIYSFAITDDWRAGVMFILYALVFSGVFAVNSQKVFEK